MDEPLQIAHRGRYVVNEDRKASGMCCCPCGLVGRNGNNVPTKLATIVMNIIVWILFIFNFIKVEVVFKVPKTFCNTK